MTKGTSDPAPAGPDVDAVVSAYRVDDLPPDLGRACALATYAAGIADALRVLLSDLPQAVDAEGISSLYATLRGVLSEARVAVQAVRGELCRIPGGLFVLAGTTAANAHDAALDFAVQVFGQARLVAFGPAEGRDPALIASEHVRAIFQRLKFPDVKTIMAAVQREAYQAAGLRETLQCAPTNAAPAGSVGVETSVNSPRSPRDLAAMLGQSVPAVESFLRRYRDKAPDCFITVDDAERRRNQPKYLYHPGDVLPALREHFGQI